LVERADGRLHLSLGGHHERSILPTSERGATERFLRQFAILATARKRHGRTRLADRRSPAASPHRRARRGPAARCSVCEQRSSRARRDSRRTRSARARRGRSHAAHADDRQLRGASAGVHAASAIGFSAVPSSRPSRARAGASRASSATPRHRVHEAEPVGARASTARTVLAESHAAGESFA
jgi:hypothetical protein